METFMWSSTWVTQALLRSIIQNRKYLGFLIEIVIELIGADKIAYKCTFIEIIRMIILNVNFNHLALMEIKVN